MNNILSRVYENSSLIHSNWLKLKTWENLLRFIALVCQYRAIKHTYTHTHMLPRFLHWRWLNMCRASGLSFECSSFFCEHCKFAERMLRSSVTIHWKRTMSRNTNIFFMFQHFFLYRSIAFALITSLIDRIKVMKIFIVPWTRGNERMSNICLEWARKQDICEVPTIATKTARDSVQIYKNQDERTMAKKASVAVWNRHARSLCDIRMEYKWQNIPIYVDTILILFCYENLKSRLQGARAVLLRFFLSFFFSLVGYSLLCRQLRCRLFCATLSIQWHSHH